MEDSLQKLLCHLSITQWFRWVAFAFYQINILFLNSSETSMRRKDSQRLRDSITNRKSRPFKQSWSDAKRFVVTTSPLSRKLLITLWDFKLRRRNFYSVVYLLAFSSQTNITSRCVCSKELFFCFIKSENISFLSFHIKRNESSNIAATAVIRLAALADGKKIETEGKSGLCASKGSSGIEDWMRLEFHLSSWEEIFRRRVKLFVSPSLLLTQKQVKESLIALHKRLNSQSIQERPLCQVSELVFFSVFL